MNVGNVINELESYDDDVIVKIIMDDIECGIDSIELNGLNVEIKVS